jgi:tetratricopeptide (TPR) repeat protein
MVAMALGACGDAFNMLKARQAFQTANGAYGTKEYVTAIEEYERCLELDPEGDRRVVLPTHFYIGSSHHLILSASRLDASARDMRIDNAIEYYTKAIELVDEGGEFQEELEIYKQYAAEQLAAIYRDNKQDFVNAERYTVMLIEMEPEKPERYYALGDVYERFHDPDEMPLLDKAIEAFEKPVEMTPEDPLAYRQMAALYNRYGRFDDTMGWLAKARDLKADDPEGFYLIATHYWDKVYRDPDLSMDDRKEFIGLGLEQLEKAREIAPEYVDALVYTGLLLREQAKIEEITGNKRRADQLIAEANQYRDRALELKKEQEAQEAAQTTGG